MATMSAWVWTVVLVPPLLFDAVGSSVPESTDAALSRRDPASRSAATVPFIVIVCVAPAASDAKVHVTVAPAAHAGAGDTETTVTPAGSGSETVTFAAGDGPALPTVSV